MKKQSLVTCTILALWLMAVTVCRAAQTQALPQTSPTPEASPAPKASPSAGEKTEVLEKDHHLTPPEAKELLASVDDVLRFVSQDTLLPIKHNVKKQIVNREQVEKYLSQKFESDVDRIRFERSELVLKKFGLLPR
ncbi:MAG TPA: hypothetical protein VFL42_15080, partial [Terriglobales bacterium]|nr:hypothetical protein [Terriglobales bacterium]